MSEAYSCRVIERDGDWGVIEVRQFHPDYSFGAEFPKRWGGVAAAGWAFPIVALFTEASDGSRTRIEVPIGGARLAQELGSFDDLYADFDCLRGLLQVTSFEVIRDGYNDENREARMRAAGFSEEEIEDCSVTPDVVGKICGLGRITLTASDPRYLGGLAAGMTWKF